MKKLDASLYQELNMQHYVSLVENILPDGNILVALCDCERQIVWTNDDSDRLLQCMAERGEAKSEHDGGSFDSDVRMFDGVSVAFCNLGELADISAGELVIYGVADTVESVSDQLVTMLDTIAKMVLSELSYLNEVNVMAAELGDRYDELSMLRSSDLDVSEYRESRHILSTYIRSCSDHLNVDFASIWIAARQQIYPGGMRYTPASDEKLALLEQLSLAAYELFSGGEVGFGINDQDEALRQKIQLPADKKVLLVPVLDLAGKPCGVLCCVNESVHNDFTNSDKETLEAVSRKTYKYLLSTQDELTGLLNRKGLEESVWREDRTTPAERYLVLFNIDQFKVINAAYGMSAGDKVLVSLAKILSNSDFGVNFGARLDADVFAVVVDASASDVETNVVGLCKLLDEHVVTVGSKDLLVRVRAGVIELNTKKSALSDHLYMAELALASAKEESNGRVVVYKSGNTALLKRKHQLTQVENIKNALAEDRFELHCQRIQPLSGSKAHYEILIRMLDEEGKLIYPDDFIPIAERYELMGAIDRWVIKNTFKLLTGTEFAGIASSYKWGINLSGVTLSDVGFLDFVSDCMCEYDFHPANLYFEITETAAIKNFQNCVSFMNKIHSLGVKFALDDFGSGLSSFSYLKKLSIDFLKIDGSLVKDIVSSRLDQTMVSAIADIAKVLNVETIAEYVENDLILTKLKSLNIDYVQGYGIMKPRSVAVELKSQIDDIASKMYSSN